MAVPIRLLPNSVPVDVMTLLNRPSSLGTTGHVPSNSELDGEAGVDIGMRKYL
eukprot:m.113680 g.113680  ORF g.113680 m.113680 type:complete len:53 (+) comp17094_c0_seq2:193-351(+)